MMHVEQSTGLPSRKKHGAEPQTGRILVSIPTTGRGAILAPVVRHLANQTRLPDVVILSGAIHEDFGDLQAEDLPFKVEYVLGPRGLCRQRNRVLDVLNRDDIVLFLDDDYILAPDFLAQLEAIFAANPDVAMATGDVIADGILGPGLSFEEGNTALEKGLNTPAREEFVDTRNAYGCNMAVRMATVFDHDLRFDEKLPLYAWFEDVDFSLRAARYGRVVKCGVLRGVHLGTKTGRTPGKKLGYSQITNLTYLRKKGVLPFGVVLKYTTRNFASNVFHTFFPLEWADHRGRAQGNLLAIGDLLLGRSDPERIIQF